MGLLASPLAAHPHDADRRGGHGAEFLWVRPDVEPDQWLGVNDDVRKTRPWSGAVATGTDIGQRQFYRVVEAVLDIWPGDGIVTPT